MQEALRTYLELAMGLTEVSRKKVRKVVKDTVGRGGATAEQLKALSADLLATNSANREALTKLVKFEVDRALGVVGLATAEEVAELNGRVRELERELAAAKATPGKAEPAPTTGPAKAAKKAASKAASKAAKTTVPAAGGAAGTPAKKATKKAAKTAATKSAPTKTAPTRTAARKSTASTSAPAKTTAKRAARKAQP